MRITQYFTRIRAHNGILWGFSLLLTRVKSFIRSKFGELALDAPGIHLGASVKILGARHINFGSNVFINGSAWIEAVTEYEGVHFDPKLSIGDGASFSAGVHISCIDHIEIGSNVLFGSHVYISDHGHGNYGGEGQTDPAIRPTKRKLGGGGPVFVEENVWIGDNVIIVGPVTIGRGAIIGANSVVRRDIPAETIAAGIPAKPIKAFDRNSRKWIPL